jgi:hypothetical protein
MTVGGLPERWSGPELEAALGEFEAALRQAELSENTVQTYVGRSQTFVRWLMGDYVPHGPKKPSIHAVHTHVATLGQNMLDELAAKIDREHLKSTLHDYAVVTNYDASLHELLHVTGGAADLSQQTHRTAVLGWLRAWGCRHLRRADEERTSEVLRHWWDEWAAVLPSPEVEITSLASTTLLDIETAYDSLATQQAAGRAVPGSTAEVEVTFGDTATAKTLFAVRPKAFPPSNRSRPRRPPHPWRGAPEPPDSARGLRAGRSRTGTRPDRGAWSPPFR